MRKRNRNQPGRRSVSEGRQGAYYLGMAMMVVGGLLFFSTFISSALNFGDFTDFENRTLSMAVRAITGMGLLIMGGFVRGIGAKGLAGSGVILDPERARRDLEPFSRQGGGMLKDGLDEAGIDLGSRATGSPKAPTTVMVRCLACDHLNEEDSRFCQDCGAPIRSKPQKRTLDAD
ncbi:hypothetical protein Poly30_50810 [Planctomycetes bacterium Poly30]|uniref:Zinc-ribbon domain-containing protein n=1 Tax=Saltatorellus ferox TaxID=2528018 RepID=A0A518EZK5_9BACT|nr:hypothetical protein Poly30_50810 [Planctomycetes bacterium Poly30]